MGKGDQRVISKKKKSFLSKDELLSILSLLPQLKRYISNHFSWFIFCLMSQDFISLELLFKQAKLCSFLTEFNMHKEFYGLDPMAQKGLENKASSIYFLKIRVAKYYKLTLHTQTEDIIKDKQKEVIRLNCNCMIIYYTSMH